MEEIENASGIAQDIKNGQLGALEIPPRVTFPIDAICHTCQGVGWIRISIGEPEPPVVRGVTVPLSYSPGDPITRLEECVCRRVSRMIDGVPRLYQRIGLQSGGFTGFATQQLEAWFHLPTVGLFITGPTGTGKTTVAAALIMAYRWNGIATFWKPAAELYRELRCAMLEGLDKIIFKDLVQTGVLAIDDIGAGSLSDFERRSTLEILESRMASMVPTIVTSNWSLGEIGERIDDRIASRLASYVQLPISGPDRRGVI